MKISLKAARVNAGFTQSDIASRCRKNKATIVAWENGKTKIDKANLKFLCALYGAKETDIFLPEMYTKRRQKEDKK